MYGDRQGSSGSSIGESASVQRASQRRRDNRLGYRRKTDVDLQPFEVGKEATGYVVTLKEDFGFLKASDLRNILKSGDEVRFVIEPSQNEEGKLHAKKVKKLEAGTINPEEEDPVVRRGILRSDNNGDLYISPSEEDAKLDENSQPIKKLKFSRHRHMKPGSKPPKVDDVVEFNVVIDKIRNRKRAKNIEVIAEAPNEQSMQGRNVGHVIRLSEDGGEIRLFESTECIEFHSDGCTTPGTFARLTCKCEVSFTICRAAGFCYAKDVKLLPSGTITAKEALGMMSGMVERMPSEKNILASDGLISYESNGSRHTVAFGLQDVHEFLPCLHAGDECRFDLMRNKFTQRLSCHGVTLMLRENQGFELGIVSMLKKNFGFIKCAERVVDVFFHINALIPTSTPLAMDADVRFLPALDQATGKIIATNLEVIAPGSAKFEVRSERRYSGTVKVVAGVAIGHAQPPDGLVTALVDGRVESLPYARSAVQGGEQPVEGQRVTFQVLEDRRAVMIAHKSARGSLKVQNGGRRAIEVLAVPKNNPQASSLGASDAACSDPSSRQSSQSSGLPAMASMQLCSARASSRPSSRDVSPIMRCPSNSHQQSMRSVSMAGTSANGFTVNMVPGASSAKVETNSSNPSLPNGHQLRARPPGTQTALVVSSPTSMALGTTPLCQPPAERSSSASRQLKPAAIPPDAKPVGKRLRGSIVRVMKKGKRFPAGIALGVLRSATNENWAKGKQRDGAVCTVHPATALLKEKGLNIPLTPGDVLFWSTDVTLPEGREMLQRNDEVEYAIVNRSLEEGDTVMLEFAIDITLVRAHRPSTQQALKWQPPAVPSLTHSSAAGVRRVKYLSSATCVVPGPEKGAIGFQAGRGRSIDGLKERVESFRLEDVITASEFVPKGTAVGDRSSAARPPLADVLGAKNFEGQFEDADR